MTQQPPWLLHLLLRLLRSTLLLQHRILLLHQNAAAVCVALPLSCATGAAAVPCAALFSLLRGALDAAEVKSHDALARSEVKKHQQQCLSWRRSFSCRCCRQAADAVSSQVSRAAARKERQALVAQVIYMQQAAGATGSFSVATTVGPSAAGGVAGVAVAAAAGWARGYSGLFYVCGTGFSAEGWRQSLCLRVSCKHGLRVLRKPRLLPLVKRHYCVSSQQQEQQRQQRAAAATAPAAAAA
ncbi:hypothetical protein ACSSS7_002111 [Eimeria intestinalis]